MRPSPARAEIVRRRSGRRVLQRVVQKLPQNLLHEIEIGVRRGQRVLQPDLIGPAVQHGFELPERGAIDFADILRAFFQMQLARFDAHHRQHFGHQPVQPVGLFVDDGHQLAFRIRAGSAEQAGDRGLNGGKGRLEIVRQRVQQRGFEHFALARRFGAGGFFKGARPLDPNGHQVSDRIQHLVGGQRAGQPQIAQRLPAQADRDDGETADAINESFLAVHQQLFVGDQRVVRPPAKVS